MLRLRGFRNKAAKPRSLLRVVYGKDTASPLCNAEVPHGQMWGSDQVTLKCLYPSVYCYLRHLEKVGYIRVNLNVVVKLFQ